MDALEEAQYYAALAFKYREQATELLEEAQRMTTLSKQQVRIAVAEEAASR